MPVKKAHALAVKVSAYVCTQNGAMPKLPEEFTSAVARWVVGVALLVKTDVDTRKRRAKARLFRYVDKLIFFSET